MAEQVSQPNIGLMRLKFWEDALEKCYSNDLRDIPKHPIALELFKVCLLYKMEIKSQLNPILGKP